MPGATRTIPPQWIYRVDEWHIPETPATTVVLSWSPQSVVTWRYEDGRYERSYGNSPHNYVTESGDRGQLTVDVLVILTGREYTASSLIPGDGTPVPATETTGHGDAWVISAAGSGPVPGSARRSPTSSRFSTLMAPRRSCPPESRGCRSSPATGRSRFRDRRRDRRPGACRCLRSR